jgi:hypothetical protein
MEHSQRSRGGGIVVRSALPRLRAVGLDVTRKVSMTPGEYRQRFSGLLLDFAGPWFSRRDRVTFHDPLAAATAFDPSLCGYVRAGIEVDADGWTSLVPGDHEVARSVVPERFFAHYFGVLARSGTQAMESPEPRLGAPSPATGGAGWRARATHNNWTSPKVATWGVNPRRSPGFGAQPFHADAPVLGVLAGLGQPVSLGLELVGARIV